MTARRLYASFCFLVMLAIFNRFDEPVEEAAWSLGVSPATHFPQDHVPADISGRALGDAVRLHAFL